MKLRSLLAAVAVASCSTSNPGAAADAGPIEDAAYDPRPPMPAWLQDARVFTSGHGREDERDCRNKICRHNENVDSIAFGGALFMVHRTARSQTLGDDSSIHVFRSTDLGTSFTDVATLQAPTGRDLRDPSLYVVGDTLVMKAITRLPVNSTRDSDVDSVTVATTSRDGVAWSAMKPIGPATWSFWRVREHAGVYYSAAYEDGDKSVSIFSSTDGLSYAKGAQIYGVAAETPLETELVFMPSGKLLALVRTDGTDAQLLAVEAPIATRVCWADPPYAKFDCPQTLDGQRLDGPVAFFWNGRLFVVARKHILDKSGRKRTSLFEIGGTLEGGPLTIKEWGELPSAGDTAYAGVVMKDDHRALVHWYSGDLFTDKPWVIAMFDITDVWQATIDLSLVK